MQWNSTPEATTANFSHGYVLKDNLDTFNLLLAYNATTIIIVKFANFQENFATDGDHVQLQILTMCRMLDRVSVDTPWIFSQDLGFLIRPWDMGFFHEDLGFF